MGFLIFKIKEKLESYTKKIVNKYVNIPKSCYPLWRNVEVWWRCNKFLNFVAQKSHWLVRGYEIRVIIQILSFYIPFGDWFIRWLTQVPPLPKTSPKARQILDTGHWNEEEVSQFRKKLIDNLTSNINQTLMM